MFKISKKRVICTKRSAVVGRVTNYQTGKIGGHLNEDEGEKMVLNVTCYF